jgi:hypothetical protein
MGMLKTAHDNPVITSIAAGAVTLTSIIGGFTALGIDPIPWATAGDIEKIERAGEDRDIKLMKLIQDMQTSQQSMQKDQRHLMRDFWSKRLEEAEEELRINPSSRTARAQKVEALRELEDLRRQEAGGSPHP